MPSFVGRRTEQQALSRLLAGALNGRSGALVVRGEPGMGKSALLQQVVNADRTFGLLEVAGVEAEMQLAFAALQRMLIPYAQRFHDLPTPQRVAVHSAFGLAVGPPADRFMMGLATLSLLTQAASRRPLLCIVDDAQWVDQASLEALALVGRRLHAEGVVLVFGTRDEAHSGCLAGLPIVQLEGLTREEALELLNGIVTAPLDNEVAERIVKETGGSPMAMIELTNMLTPEQLSDPSLLIRPLPLSRRLEEHFLRRVRVLPAETQTLLLVAAADGTDNPRLVATAASLLGVGPDAHEPAEAAGILVPPGSTFRHPLIRSAVYGAASGADRRRAHGALAASLDRTRERVRRAWHQSAATVGHDDEVALELVQAAEEARPRGGGSTVGSLLARAAELTVDDHQRVDRVLAAGWAELEGGAPARARALVVGSLLDGADPLQRGMAQRLHGQIGYALGEAHGTARILMDAARAVDPFDRRLARATLLEAMAAARVTGTYTELGAGEVDVGALARRMPMPPSVEPTIGDLLLDGNTALFLDGHAAAVGPLRRAVTALRDEPVDSVQSLEWLAIGCWAAGALGDDEALHFLATRLVRSATDLGAPVWLSIGLMFLAMSEQFDGSLDVAGGHFTERAEILAAIGRPLDVGALVMHAWEGDEGRTRVRAEEVTQHAMRHGHGWMLVFVDYALVIIELGLGNYQAAFATATKDYQANPFLSIVAFPNLIEAAVRCGRRDAALDALEDYHQRAVVSGTPTTLGFLARSRALLADDDHAEALYKQSILHFQQSRGDLQRARVHLLYGEWLRRRKRRLDARAELRTAHSIFLSSGAGAFADRARAELAATGERARKRTVDTTKEFTPQEAQVAALAAQGATNPEIAAKLFLSPATVDYHLRKVYRKLDIGSRRKLGSALAAARAGSPDDVL